MNLHIPADLGPLLQDFAVAVLTHSPENLLDFAVAVLTHSPENLLDFAVAVLTHSPENLLDFAVAVLTHSPENLLDFAVAVLTHSPENLLDFAVAVLTHSPENLLDFAVAVLTHSPENLLDFAVAVLTHSPENLLDFAVEHFKKIQGEAKVSHDDAFPASHGGSTEPQASSNGSAVKSKVPMYIIVDDDEAGEPDPALVKPKTNKNKFARRSFVSAERYDPEADEAAEDGQEVVHAKSPEQRARLAQAVTGILLFKSLDDAQLGRVVDAMFERRVTPNEMAIRQGDDGDNFYVIDRGRYGVLVSQDGHEKRVHQFENVGSFGELALLYRMPRSASIVAETDRVLWAMDRASFRRIVQRAAFKKRKLYEELLKEVPMLNTLDEYERMNVADALTSESFPDGHADIQQGDEADGMYFIEDGSVSVRIRKGDQEVEVIKLHKGKYFGEVALIEDKPRTAAVYAAGPVKLAFLERESFERLLGPCLDIMKRNSSKYKKNQKGK
ncbi:hypothetical protein RRG08_022605 [Elysia crispata]|uniref:cAMP-dependent protein kinase type II regulatory subunit n=1 Tax=Elysia crispata TaxID=231223 RepID=A0AAE1D911_9GAST|nr:hypothetical protein RRG08_022605 [Elysia crispata]